MFFAGNSSYFIFLWFLFLKYVIIYDFIREASRLRFIFVGKGREGGGPPLDEAKWLLTAMVAAAATVTEKRQFMHEEGEELPHKSKGESPISETGGFS